MAPPNNLHKYAPPKKKKKKKKKLKKKLKKKIKKNLCVPPQSVIASYGPEIIVSSIKFRKGFAKFMMPIALIKKFLS